jgi:DNA helicase HerA-like ATPase
MNVELKQPLNVVGLGREHRDPSASRVLGHLVSLNGMHALIATHITTEGAVNQWSVGHLITIKHDAMRLVGVVCELTAADHIWTEAETNVVMVKVELNGVVVDDPNGIPRFHRGIQSYPRLGAVAHNIRASDLAAIYSFNGREGIEIGTLSQNESIPAKVSVKELISRHFAVIGSTGVGKTTTVSMLIQKSLAERKNLRVLIIDPHNEFARQFPGNSISLDSDNLELPFWMFKFEEMIDIIFAGRKPSSEETDALFDLIKLAKLRFAGGQAAAPAAASALSAVRRPSTPESSNISADTPVPYRMSDAMQVLDGWMGKLDHSYPLPVMRALKNRLEALSRDARFRFMFGKSLIDDNMGRIISKIFRIPADDKPVTIVQLAGLPNEVVNSVVSVLARLAFDIALWSGGGYEIAVVCEEAHRYIPNDRSLGFGPTRAAIGRIAKEGRKYGASLGVVTQRPSELDSTVLSQCSTMFVMRLPNESDKAIIRSALAESSGSIVSFLSSLADREAIAFGEAIPTPMRMRFASIKRPTATVEDLARVREAAPMSGQDVHRVVRRLRGEAVTE